MEETTILLIIVSFALLAALYNLGKNGTDDSTYLRDMVRHLEYKLEKTTQTNVRILEILDLLTKKMKEFEEKIDGK